MNEEPIIWKHEGCLRGECKEDRIEHWWSLPFSCAFGLVCECYHCHKTREVKLE